MNELKSFTLYSEIFRLIDTIEPIEKRNEFLGQIIDFYFKNKKPNLKPKSYEEIVWLNISKPINKCKNKAINGSKGGRPKKNNETEIKSKMESKSENKTITTSDVNVVVNNNITNNKNNTSNYSSRDSNRDRVIGEEEEKEKKEVPVSITNFVENNYGRSLTPYEFEEVIDLVKEYSEPIVLKAYQVAFEQSRNSLSYIKGILKNWKDSGLDTLGKIEEDLKRNLKKTLSERKLDSIFARARARMDEKNE